MCWHEASSKSCALGCKLITQGRNFSPQHCTTHSVLFCSGQLCYLPGGRGQSQGSCCAWAAVGPRPVSTMELGKWSALASLLHVACVGCCCWSGMCHPWESREGRHKGVTFCLISVLILWGNRGWCLFSSAFRMFGVGMSSEMCGVRFLQQHFNETGKWNSKPFSTPSQMLLLWLCITCLCPAR